MVSRWLAITGGVLVLALLAGGLTEGALAFGRLGTTADDWLVRPAGSLAPTAASPSPRPSASPSPTVVATATPAPVTTPTPAPTPAGPTAVTNSFVHLRASNTTSSAILTDLNGGTTVELLPYSDSQWQKVQYNGFTGYVFKAYLSY